MPPTPLEVRAFGAGKIYLDRHESVWLWPCVATVLMVEGRGGGGGWQLFPTEFGKLCVPLKKSWLRPWYCVGSVRPDKSTNKIQINFCLLTAEHYISLCRHKESSLKLNDFLRYFKYLFQLETIQTIIPEKWEPFVPYLWLWGDHWFSESNILLLFQH